MNSETVTLLCQPKGMARGWESKDIESQMADARAEPKRPAPPLNSAETQSVREREALMLHRTRVLADLQSAVNPGYREILKRSLTFLDEKLASLSRPDSPK